MSDSVGGGLRFTPRAVFCMVSWVGKENFGVWRVARVCVSLSTRVEVARGGGLGAKEGTGGPLGCHENQGSVIMQLRVPPGAWA